MGNKSSKQERQYWRDDNDSKVCEICEASFGFIRRRHHCRSCGGLFCDHCSTHRIPVPSRGFLMPVRVCSLCNMKGDDTRGSSTPKARRRASDMHYRVKRGGSGLDANSNAPRSSASWGGGGTRGGLGGSRTASEAGDATSQTGRMTPRTRGLVRQKSGGNLVQRSTPGVSLPEQRAYAVFAFIYALTNKRRRYTTSQAQSAAMQLSQHLVPFFSFDSVSATSQSPMICKNVRFLNRNCSAYVSIPRLAKKQQQPAPMFATAGAQYDDDETGISSRLVLDKARHAIVPFTPWMSVSTYTSPSVTLAMTLPIKSEVDLGDMYDIQLGLIPEGTWNTQLLSANDPLAVSLASLRNESSYIAAVDLGALCDAREAPEESPVMAPFTVARVAVTPDRKAVFVITARGMTETVILDLGGTELRWKLVISVTAGMKAGLGLELL